MGRTSRWLRSFLGGKKEPKHQANPPPPPPPPAAAAAASSSKDLAVDDFKKLPKEKRRWSFRRSVKDQAAEPPLAVVEPRPSCLENYILESESEQSKHAIAVAAATAAAADAAVAAAQAAAAVVRLTSSGCAVGYGVHSSEHWAATRIQTAFRGYLAKRALCALKSLVKLQALVRGHIVRKQAAETLRSMQALVRVQARIRARRVRMSEEGQAVQRQLLQRRQQEPNPRRSTTEGWNGSTYSMHQHEAKVQSRQAAVNKRERALTYSFSQQEIERRLDESAKIVEVDTCRPKSSSNRKKGSMSESETAEDSIFSTTYSTLYALYNPAVRSTQPTCSPPQIEGQFASPLVVSPVQSECVTASALHDFSPRTLSGKYGYAEDSTFSTAESSPQYYSAASKAEAKRGPFTPSKPEYETFFQDYAAFPNYMANTESSKAKLRSHSAPKQRPESPEKMLLMAKKRSSLPRAGENRMNFCGARMQRSSSHVGINCKGFLHSGSIALDRSTMSLRDSECDTVSISNGDYRRSFLAMEGEQQKRPSPGKRR